MASIKGPQSKVLSDFALPSVAAIKIETNTSTIFAIFEINISKGFPELEFLPRASSLLKESLVAIALRTLSA